MRNKQKALRLSQGFLFWGKIIMYLITADG